MEKWNETEYPDVLKTIILTDAARRRHRRQFRLSQRLRNGLAELMHRLMEGELNVENEEGDELAKRFGYDDLYALQDAGCALSVDWMTGNVALRGKKEESKKENNHA